MEQNQNTERQRRNWLWILAYAALFFLIVLVSNTDAINDWLKGALTLLRPILIGLALAYLCNPIFRLFERMLFCKLRPPALRRALSLTMTYICIFLVLALVVLLVLPQLVSSLSDFASNYKSYLQSATDQLNLAIASINAFAYDLSGNEALLTYLEPNELESSIASLFGAQNTDQFFQTLAGLDMKPLFELIGNAMSIVTDTIFAIFISVYLLSTKEKRYAQVMKVRRAFFDDTVNQRITRFCTIADRSFGGFLEGKLLDSLIVGILLFILLVIFGVPYAVLIASIICISNIIPLIGPFIGAVPAALILLISAPTKLIPFLLIVILIQQLDGNVISPKLLGNNTGVSPLCVMIAISTLGALWGLVGMVLAVPLFATVLEMADEAFTARLQKKGMPSGVENYYASDVVVDPSNNAHVTIDRIAKRFERYVVRLQADDEAEPNGKHRRKHRLMLWIHKLLVANGVIRQLTDEEQARFSADAAATQAEQTISAMLDEMRREPEDEDDQANEIDQADKAREDVNEPQSLADTDEDATVLADPPIEPTLDE